MLNTATAHVAATPAPAPSRKKRRQKKTMQREEERTGISLNETMGTRQLNVNAALQLDWTSLPPFLPQPVLNKAALSPPVDESTGRQTGLTALVEEARIPLAAFGKSRDMAVPSVFSIINHYIGDESSVRKAKKTTVLKSLSSWVLLRPYLLHKMASRPSHADMLQSNEAWSQVLKGITPKHDWAHQIEVLGLSLSGEEVASAPAHAEGASPDVEEGEWSEADDAATAAIAPGLWHETNAVPLSWKGDRAPVPKDANACVSNSMMRVMDLFESGPVTTRAEELRHEAAPLDWRASECPFFVWRFNESVSAADAWHMAETTRESAQRAIDGQRVVEFWDYKLRRRLLLPPETDVLYVLGGERLLRDVPFYNAAGPVDPSRLIWPAISRSNQAEPVWLSGRERLRLVSPEAAIVRDEPSPPTRRPEEFDNLAQFLKSLSQNPVFEGCPLEPYVEHSESWLSEEWIAVLVYDIAEHEFRHAVFTLDLGIRICHPEIAALHAASHVERFNQLMACWGAGGFSPDYRQGNWLASPDRRKRAHALRRFSAFMLPWPRATSFLPMQDELSAIDVDEPREEDLAVVEHQVWRTYLQTYWDYTRCAAFVPFVMPSIPLDLQKRLLA